jgi:hypothetical protein
MRPVRAVIRCGRVFDSSQGRGAVRQDRPVAGQGAEAGKATEDSPGLESPEVLEEIRTFIYCVDCRFFFSFVARPMAGRSETAGFREFSTGLLTSGPALSTFRAT